MDELLSLKSTFEFLGKKELVNEINEEIKRRKEGKPKPPRRVENIPTDELLSLKDVVKNLGQEEAVEEIETELSRRKKQEDIQNEQLLKSMFRM